MSDDLYCDLDYEIDPGDVDWPETAATLQREVNHLIRRIEGLRGCLNVTRQLVLIAEIDLGSGVKRRDVRKSLSSAEQAIQQRLVIDSTNQNGITG